MFNNTFSHLTHILFLHTSQSCWGNSSCISRYSLWIYRTCWNTHMIVSLYYGGSYSTGCPSPLTAAHESGCCVCTLSYLYRDSEERITWIIVINERGVGCEGKPENSRRGLVVSSPGRMWNPVMSTPCDLMITLLAGWNGVGVRVEMRLRTPKST